eukprot:11210458-Alexandrium_andersonii.AAC.1
MFGARWDAECNWAKARNDKIELRNTPSMHRHARSGLNTRRHTWVAVWQTCRWNLLTCASLCTGE